MINIKNKKIYCITPLPLLWYFNNFLAIGAFLVSIILIIFFIIRSLRNKIKKQIIFDKKAKVYCLWLVTTVTFLISFVFSSSDYYLYVISLLVLTLFLLINLSIAKKYSLFKVKNSYWIVVIIFFIGISIVSFINILKGYDTWRQEKELKIAFEKILPELPELSDIEKKVLRTQSISYYVPKDGKELVNFYKSAFSNTQWQFLDEKKRNYNHDLYYQRDDNNEWLNLNFSWSSPDNKIIIQGRNYPFTYLTVYFYNTKPCLPSDKDCIRIDNPLDFTCENSWF